MERMKHRFLLGICESELKDAELAGIADFVQVFPVADQVDPGNVIAMGSTLMHAVWGDCLAVALMQMRGYGWADVVFTHPFGAVGKLEDLPVELPSLPIPDAE